MLARRVGLLTNSRNVFSTARRPLLNTPWQCRNYALSRFDERRPGGGRERPKLAPRDAQNRRSRGEAEKPNDWQSEQQFLGEQSPLDLWEASQRPPASNPEEGLKRLLLENNQLLITRLLRSIPKVTYPMHVLMLVPPGKSKCSISLWALNSQIDISSVSST